jgi:calcineurin-like phosphoesterase family protein
MTDKLNGEGLPFGAAWIWQLQIHENLDEFVEEFMQNVNNSESVASLLFCLDLLRMRGQSNAVSQILNRLTSERKDLITSNQLKFIELLQTTKVGVFREINEYSLLEL